MPQSDEPPTVSIAVKMIMRNESSNHINDNKKQKENTIFRRKRSSGIGKSYARKLVFRRQTQIHVISFFKASFVRSAVRELEFIIDQSIGQIFELNDNFNFLKIIYLSQNNFIQNFTLFQTPSLLE